MERLRSFENHPFKVKADSQMIELQESVKKYGILNPLIVRPRKDGTYEIISGHRRKFAAEKIGYRKVPVIIRVLKDDDAVVSMVDSNLQREMISPSEKAFAYKMKYEVIKRRAGRRKCGQVDHNLGKKSIELIGEECGDSPKQVQRYIKITDLIPEMLEKVDDGSMGFANMGASFHEKLFELIATAGVDNKDVWKNANLDRKHFSKIQCDENYHPKKKTVMALCISLHLDLEQSKDLMARADWAFSPSSKFDLIVQKAIIDKQYDIMQLNVTLFKYTNEILGV